MLSSAREQSRLEQTGGTSAVPVWATSDNVVAVADVVVVFVCSCCYSCCFWCCCKFHFRCFIVVAGIILRHLSQSWHDWLDQSRKQTTQLESWTRRQLGRLDRLHSLDKWTLNWTWTPVQPAQLVKWTGGTTRGMAENYITNTADTSYADVQFGGNQRR